MKQFLLGLSLSFAFILGCVTAAAVTSQAHAEATPAGGGGECFGMTFQSTSSINLSEGKAPKTAQIPRGWYPVGGGGSDGAATVILCRNTSTPGTLQVP